MTGSSTGVAKFTDSSNAIGNLGAFTNTGGAFSLTDSSGLTITGTLDATGKTVTLVDSNASGMTENGTGIIKAATLTGSSSGVTTFNNASNAIGNLGAFTNTSAAFSLKDGSALTITGTLDATGQTVTLVDTNASGMTENGTGIVKAGHAHRFIRAA